MPEVNFKGPRFLDLFSCCLIDNADKLPSVPGTFSFALPWIIDIRLPVLALVPNIHWSCEEGVCTRKAKGFWITVANFPPKTASYKVHISA